MHLCETLTFRPFGCFLCHGAQARPLIDTECERGHDRVYLCAECVAGIMRLAESVPIADHVTALERITRLEEQVRNQEDQMRELLGVQEERDRLAGELDAARSELVNLRSVLAERPASSTLGEFVAESKAHPPRRGRAKAAT